MARHHSTIAFLLTLPVLTGCVALSRIGLEDVVVYQPLPGSEDVIDTPGLAKQDVFFQSDNGVQLHGWYCEVKEPRAIVLFAHGNAGSIEQRWQRLRWMTQVLNVSVLAFDYRGYGRSEGEPSEHGLIADAKAARRKLAQLAGVAESEVVLYGRSLGGAVMVQLAADDGACGLVLESTFTSLPSVAQYKIPYLPRIARSMKNQFASIDRIAEYRGPLLVAHGERDFLTPVKMGRELYAAANEPKRFFSAPEARHNWAPTLLYTAEFSESLTRPATGEL